MSAQSESAIHWLGVDTGGTFTDFVYSDGRHLRVHKVLSTPDAPEQAILQGIKEMGIDLRQLDLVHGSTVATNAVLERKGVKTLFVTNHGFADMLTIGRQARPELYELQPDLIEPPVPRELCIETGGRVGSDGSVLEGLIEEDIQRVLDAIREHRPAAVAINFLFSFLEPEPELKLAAALPAELFVSVSSQVLAEYREYERGIATWLNAWIGPHVQKYLERLRAGTEPCTLTVMQSSGGTIGVDEAGSYAVNLLLSGPAGGLQGARYMSALSGEDRLLTLDMGGTSTDVAMLDGAIGLTSDGNIAGYPVAVPMVDMHTIGAGGGSIAYLDAGGLLQVGPESAGANPGPACYGQGGKNATVTDANLFLGRLLPDAFLGGHMKLDVAAAEEAIEGLAQQLGCSALEAAQGIIALANEHMTRALRVISVERGIDPTSFTLVSFGGAGGLHVCALAQALGMQRILVPVNAGVLSALGMLVAPKSRELSQTLTLRRDEATDEQIEQYFQELKQKGISAMAADGVVENELEFIQGVDVCYLGQSSYLNLPWQSLSDLDELFHAKHEQRYGHRLHAPLQLVNIRLHVRERRRRELNVGAATPVTTKQDTVTTSGSEIPAMPRESLQPGSKTTGPLLITETVATTFVDAGWNVECDENGNLVLTLA